MSNIRSAEECHNEKGWSPLNQDATFQFQHSFILLQWLNATSLCNFALTKTCRSESHPQTFDITCSNMFHLCICFTLVEAVRTQNPPLQGPSSTSLFTIISRMVHCCFVKIFPDGSTRKVIPTALFGTFRS